MERIILKKGQWRLASYGLPGAKRTYWVYNLPFKETLLQFPNLKKAKEYFIWRTKDIGKVL